MNKNPQQTSETKAKLKEAFWKLYEQNPIDQITVKEITALSGHNRGTFYVYYRDVYDVFEQTQDEILRIFVNNQDAIPQPGNEAQFDSAMRYFVEFFNQNKRYLILLLGEKGDLGFTRRIWEALRRMLTTAFKEKSPLDDITFEYVMEYMLSAEAGLVIRWFRNNCDMPLEELIRLAHSLMFDGALKMLLGNNSACDNITPNCK